MEGDNPSCPKCGFGSYSAHYVYGDAVYRYKHTQIPWMNRKIDKRRNQLLVEIEESVKVKEVTSSIDLKSIANTNGRA